MEENKEFVTVKIKHRKGEYPSELAGTEWWTKEEWDKYYAYVEELKLKGEYLQEDEYTFTYPKGAFDMFIDKTEKPFSNFGILIPNKSK